MNTDAVAVELIITDEAANKIPPIPLDMPAALYAEIYKPQADAINEATLFVLRDLQKRFPESIGAALVASVLVLKAIQAIATLDNADSIDIDAHEWKT